MQREIVFRDCDEHISPPTFVGINSLSTFEDGGSITRPEGKLFQLHQLFAYAHELGCQCVAIETQHIDRDFMEDFASFYSRCLKPYSNRCKRVHFFASNAKQTEAAIDHLKNSALGMKRDDYKARCRDFSRQHYLGFSVIKPLDGTPIGRTVLSAPKHIDGEFLNYLCSRDYQVHLSGVELTVTGLAFQQQDIGVSACATTATWSSLQMLQAHEMIAAPTPAQITTFATQRSMATGRAMPSDGLTVDQICQAIQAVGIAPYYAKVRKKPHVAKASLFTSIRSGIAPILIVSDMHDNQHGVTVVGMRIKKKHEFHAIRVDHHLSAVDEAAIGTIDDLSADLVGLYVHDDRVGPYSYAEWNQVADQGYGMIRLVDGPWIVTGILTPMYPKVRLPLSGLRKMAIVAADKAGSIFDLFSNINTSGGDADSNRPSVRIDHWIEREFRYLERCFIGEIPVSAEAKRRLSLIPLPRYIGVIRLSSEEFDTLDLLVDTTCTVKNPNFLCVIPHGSECQLTAYVASLLSTDFGIDLDCVL